MMHDWWADGGFGMEFGCLTMPLPLAILAFLSSVQLGFSATVMAGETGQKTPHEIIIERFAEG